MPWLKIKNSQLNQGINKISSKWAGRHFIVAGFCTAFLIAPSLVLAQAGVNTPLPSAASTSTTNVGVPNANSLQSASTSTSAVPLTLSESASNYFSRLTDLVVDSFSEKSESLINDAMKLIGVRYRWGADVPQSGLDASGFVRYVFNDKLGFLIPRKSTQMSRIGKPVQREELQPGDLVFFNTMRLTFSHVGIYVGDNKFIHSPAKGATVRVDDMSSSYWERRFDGARRLDGSDELSDQERKQLLQEIKTLKKEARIL